MAYSAISIKVSAVNTKRCQKYYTSHKNSPEIHQHKPETENCEVKAYHLQTHFLFQSLQLNWKTSNARTNYTESLDNDKQQQKEVQEEVEDKDEKAATQKGWKNV